MIIEKVAETFNKQGYYATSLNDLIKITGLSKGSIYGNFKNKEEVAVEAFQYNIRKLTDAFRRESDKSSDSIEKLLSYVNVYRKENKNFILRGGCPLLNTLVESDDMNDQLKELAIKVVLAWKMKISEIITAGIRAGEINKNSSPLVTADLMISLFEGAGILTKVCNDECYMNNALNHIEKLITDLKKN